MSPLILIDAMNVAIRSHYAFRGLRDSQDFPTGVIFGFLKAVLSLKRIYGNRLVVCWDNGLPVLAADGGLERGVPIWRKVIYPRYKSNRKPEESLQEAFLQLPEIRRVMGEQGWLNVGVPGLEADDLIGILSATVSGEVVIFSSDKDFYQLLEGERVRILRPGKKNGKLVGVTQHSAERFYALPMAQWAGYLALGGDHSDMVKVLAGVGEKGALRMMQEGARPDLPFGENPIKIQQQYSRHRNSWPQVEQIYRLVQLPRNCEDPRLASCLKGISFCPGMLESSSGPPQQGEPARQRLEAFTRFCALHDLDQFLAQRKEFIFP